MQRSYYLQPSSGTSREPDTAEDRVTITSNLLPAWEGEHLYIQPLFLAPSPPRKPFNQFEWTTTFHQAKTRSLSFFFCFNYIYIYIYIYNLYITTHPHAIFVRGFSSGSWQKPTANGLDGLIGFRWLGPNGVTKSRGWNSISLQNVGSLLGYLLLVFIYIYIHITGWARTAFIFLWLKTRQVECNHLVFYDYCSIAIIKGGYRGSYRIEGRYIDALDAQCFERLIRCWGECIESESMTLHRFFMWRECLSRWLSVVWREGERVKHDYEHSSDAQIENHSSEPLCSSMLFAQVTA